MNDPFEWKIVMVPFNGSVILIAVSISFSMSVSFCSKPGARIFNVLSSFVV